MDSEMMAISDGTKIIHVGVWDEKLSGPLPRGATVVEITDQDLADLRSQAERPRPEIRENADKLADLEARIAALEKRLSTLEVASISAEELK
jgi:hypothetical protein